jgi:hypothetical protein
MKMTPLLGISNLYREFIIFLGGLSGIVLLFAITGFLTTIFETALYAGGRIEFFLLIILFSYALGKVLLIATEFATQILYFVVTLFCSIFLNENFSVKNRLETIFSKSINDWRQILRRNLVRAGRPEQLSEADVERLITYLEFAEVEKEYPSIRSTLDKFEITEIIVRFICAYSFFCALFNVRYSWAVFAAASIALYIAYRNRSSFFMRIYQGIAKKTFKDRRTSLSRI